MVLLLIITLLWDFALRRIFLQTNSSTFQNISNKMKALWNIVKNIHVQNIQWSFIPHVAFYRLPVWNGHYENETKCDLKLATVSSKIIINLLKKKKKNKKPHNIICTVY